MRERVIERFLTSYAKEHGGRAYKFVSPGQAGVPDRLVILPGGVMFFVELKAPTGILSPRQEKVIKDLSALGARVHVASSKADIRDIFRYEV